MTSTIRSTGIVILSILLVLSSLNIIAEWDLFGKYDGAVPAILIIFGIIVFYVLPSAKRA